MANPVRCEKLSEGSEGGRRALKISAESPKNQRFFFSSNTACYGQNERKKEGKNSRAKKKEKEKELEEEGDCSRQPR